MCENLAGSAFAGAQRSFHQACPGSGGVLTGEMHPAQRGGDEIIVAIGYGDGQRDKWDKPGSRTGRLLPHAALGGRRWTRLGLVDDSQQWWLGRQCLEDRGAGQSEF